MLEVPIACGTRFEICASLKFTYGCPPYPPNAKTGTPQKPTERQRQPLRRGGWEETHQFPAPSPPRLGLEGGGFPPHPSPQTGSARFLGVLRGKTRRGDVLAPCVLPPHRCRPTSVIVFKRLTSLTRPIPPTLFILPSAGVMAHGKPRENLSAELNRRRSESCPSPE